MRKKSPGNFDWQLWLDQHQDLFLYGSKFVTATSPDEEIIEEIFEETGELATDELVSILTMGLAQGEGQQFRDDCALTLGRIGGGNSFQSLWRNATVRSNSAGSDLTEAVAMGLAYTGNKAVIGYLQTIIKDATESLETKGIAIAGLGVLGTSNKESVRFMMDIVEQPRFHDDLKATACLALGFMRGSYSTEFLRKRLAKETSVYLKSHLLAALALTCDPSLTDTFIEHCTSPDQHVRWTAINGLGGLLDGTGTLTGETSETVGWSTRNLESHRKKASAILRSIARKGSDDGSKAFSSLSLGRIGGAENIAALREQSKKAQGQLRSCAVLGLGLAGARDAEDDMIRLLADPSEVDECRAAACVALGILRNASKSARNRLKGALSGHNPFVIRYYATLGLGMLRDHSSGLKLRKIVLSRNEPVFMRFAAATGLSLLGSSTAVETVSAAIRREDDPDIQAKLLASLGSSPTRAPMTFLLEILEGEGDPLTKAAATHSVGHIVNQHRPPLFARLLSNRNYFLKAKPLVELNERM